MPDTGNINSVYCALLDQLELSQHHKERLEKRGFNAKQIKIGGYKSLPIKRKTIVDQLAAEFSLEGVPGFYFAEKGWKLAGRVGMLMPVRNATGELVGLKVRADDDKVEGKYTQISSDPGKMNDHKEPTYPKGAKATIAVHYPCHKEVSSTIRITEGELKADIATLLTDQYTLSLPGVSMWKWVIPELEKLKPVTILLAFDSDKDKAVSTSTPREKPFAVGIALANLYSHLKSLEYNVFIEHWEGEFGKGIDDVVAGGMEDKIRHFSAEECEDFVSNNLMSGDEGDYIYAIQPQKFYSSDAKRCYTKDMYNDMQLAIIGSKGGSPANKALANPAFPVTEDITYYPNKPRIVVEDSVKKLNIWQEHPVKPCDGDPSIFVDHVNLILPNPAHAHTFTQFLAYNVKHPGEKIHWAVLLQGKPGVGKSYFKHVMQLLLGTNVSFPSNEEMHEQYTAWQKGCSFVAIEEVMMRGRLDLMNKLKPIITEPFTTIREMRRDSYSYPNRLNLLMLTNHEDAILLDRDERRYYVLFSSAEKQSDDYYDELFHWTDANPGVICNYLMEYNLSDFKPKANPPDTEYRQEVILSSRTPVQEWVEDGIENSNWPFQGTVVATMHLMECLLPHIRTNPQALGRALARAGAKKEATKIKLESGQQVTLWVLRRGEMIDSHENRAKFLRDEYERWKSTQNPGGNPLLDMEDI